jgi:hypothetical protein
MDGMGKREGKGEGMREIGGEIARDGMRYGMWE